MRLRRRLAAIAFASGAAVVSFAPAASAAPGDIYGVDLNNKFVRFSSASPGTVTQLGSINGLASGESVVGLDFRPSDGQLYALTNQSRLYTVNVSNGAATLKSTLNVPLNGNVFGVDFNPVPDRLRVVSDTDQNLRINVDTGATTVDGMINYPDGQNPFVSGVAYTNPDNDTATNTELFDIDFGRNLVALQEPPNSGTLAIRGSLGNNPIRLIGFDIGRDNVPFAAYTDGNNQTPGDRLFRINTTNGMATDLGPIGSTDTQGDLVAIAIELPQPPPPPVIPEVPTAAVLPLAGLGLLGGAMFFLRRRSATALPTG